jgi:uncharacterized protein YcbK (DUF882 family)
MDWNRWPNFSPEEFRCKHTGKLHMHGGFVDKLQNLRTLHGKPLRVTSGYRDATHPIEAAKAVPGAHASGRAADIAVQGEEAIKIIELAIKLGFTGIGVQQKGNGRFIHLDDLPNAPGRPRPHIWSY